MECFSTGKISRARLFGRLILVVSMASGLAACAADPGTASDGTVQVLMYKDQIYRLPVAVAGSEQMFDERGITVEEVSMPSNLTTAQALDATGANIAQMTVPTYAQGFQELDDDLVFFCGSLSITGVSLMAPPGSEFPSIAEGANLDDVLGSLEGRTIGILTPTGSALHEMFVQDLESHGVDVDKITFVNVGASGQVTRAALENDSVDIIQTGSPLTEDLLTNGEAKELAFLPEHQESIFGGMYGAAWVAKRSWIEEDRESAKAFCDGIGSAVEFIENPDNRESVIGVYQDDAQYLSREAADMIVENVTERGVFSIEVPQESFEKSVETLLDMGVINQEPLPIYSDQVIELQ